MEYKKHPEHGYPLEDGNGRLSSQEIIRLSLEAHGRENELKDMYGALQHLLQSNKYRLLREGNTLFLINILSPGECNLAIFSGESSAKELLRSIKSFYTGMLAAGYKTLHTDSDLPSMVQYLRNIGMNVEVTGQGKGNMQNLTIRAPE